jgi:hypothetical protein
MAVSVGWHRGQGAGWLLPIGVLLRATDPSCVQLGRRPVLGLAECEGYRVDGMNGRVGTVVGVGIGADGETPAWLVVRTGLFHRRQVSIGIEDVGSVDPIARRIVVSTGRAPGDVGG